MKITNRARKNDSIIGHIVLIIGSIAILTLIMFFPPPTEVLVISMVINFIFSLLSLTILSLSPWKTEFGHGRIFRDKKVTDYTFLPSTLLISAAFGLMIHVSFTRLILTTGAAIDEQLILNILSPFSVSNTIKIIASAFFTIVIAIQAVTIIRSTTYISVLNALFLLNTGVYKQMNMDIECASAAITNEEAIIKKNNLQSEFDFYKDMDGAGKFISGIFWTEFFVTAISIIGGIIIGVKFQNRSISASAGIYIPLSIAFCFLAQFPIFLKSIIMKIIGLELEIMNSEYCFENFIGRKNVRK